MAFLAEHAVLIQHLVEPLAQLLPALDTPELLARARTLFFRRARHRRHLAGGPVYRAGAD